MYNSTCSRCQQAYSCGRYSSAAFCPGCHKDIQDEAAAATRHRSKIMSGDPYERPENDQEAREVRAVIRRRYGLNSTTKDSKYSWENAA